MIKSLGIKNFQSWKDAGFEFVAGVNVIIGPTDSGKSAIVRAINWPVTNRPLGDDFRSEWGGDTEVYLEFEMSGVTRVRRASENAYILSTESGQTVLQAFGHNPPEAALDILGLDFVNIQFQDEPPFLISATPGEVAQLLNKAANIDDIDVATNGLKRELASHQTRLSMVDDLLETRQNDLSRYNNLDDLDGQMTAAEQLANQMTQLYRNKLDLSKLVERISHLENELRNKPTIDRAYEKLLSANVELDNMKDKRRQRDQLQNLLNSINQTEKIQNGLRQILQEQITEYDKLKPNECPLCGGKMK